MKCEICKKEVLSLDKHHIHSKSLGGKNNTRNIANICPNCHRLVHMGLIILEGQFDTTHGQKLVWRKYGDESVTGLKDPPVYIQPNTEDLRKLYLKRNK